MKINLYQVDSFTASAFRGNPAGVCLLETEAPESWMQRVAAEMNLSETAFVCPHTEGLAIRYFTPTTEVPLCGHATLASAHVLWETGRVPASREIGFQAAGGTLRARREQDWICMDFPADVVQPAPAAPDLEQALGARPAASFQGSLLNWRLLEFDSERTIRALQPDFVRLKDGKFGPFMVTARSDQPAFDFVSRFFAPDVGIDEDPVTGAAHCSLGPFWGQRLGKTEMIGRQVSRRGGVVRVRVKGPRVDILGQATTVFRGEWLAPPPEPKT